MRLLDGKTISNDWLNQLSLVVQAYHVKYGCGPVLKIVRINHDDASIIYTDRKLHVAQTLGFDAELIELPVTISFSALTEFVGALNDDIDVDAILIQLPLPSQLDASKVVDLIDKAKDVDGLTTQSMGALLNKVNSGLVSCTPLGIQKLLQVEHIQLVGQHVVMVGDSKIVGRPMAVLCLNQGATVTICNSKTQNLLKHVAQADVLIVAIGQRDVIQPEWIKPGAIVIDVGINRDESGRLVGDIPYKACEHVGLITPVPGGVGPMTVAALMHNTLKAACQRRQNEELLNQLLDVKNV